MTTTEINNWQAVQTEVLRRIHKRIWKPGEMIPNEKDIALEFGCARATVNRALRNLSDDGLLERRRKAGTRVALHPVRKATLQIPMIRNEIEDQNQEFGYLRISREQTRVPTHVRARMQADEHNTFLHIKSLYLADNTPFAFEDRWINLSTVPDAADFEFETISANEWLLTNTPYTRGDIVFSALDATAEIAENLGIPDSTAVFVIERTTWDHDQSVTNVRQFFKPGYTMQTKL